MESSEDEVGQVVKMSKIARRLQVTGRVQGVGYRAALCAVAEELGLDGWVRNRSDGSVEAEVCGPSDAVQALVDWARQGPPAARVAGVSVETIEPNTARGGFAQLPTL
jgi:acylphosphatase